MQKLRPDMDIGHNIQRLRKASNMTQDQVIARAVYKRQQKSSIFSWNSADVIFLILLIRIYCYILFLKRPLLPAFDPVILYLAKNYLLKIENLLTYEALIHRLYSTMTFW